MQQKKPDNRLIKYLTKAYSILRPKWRAGGPKPRIRQAIDPEFLARVYSVSDIASLRAYFDWQNTPELEFDAFRPQPRELYHLNSRRWLDAQVLAWAARNAAKTAIVEIGTSEGKTTTLLAQNAPDSTVYTVDIDPSQTNQGKLITHVLGRDRIGWAYRDAKCGNIEQIFCDTLTWSPNLPLIDIAFIDRCHDPEYIINDTRKLLPSLRKSGLILWHDFSPELSDHFPWIKSVILGVQHLYEEGDIAGPILHVKDSFIGIYEI